MIKLDKLSLAKEPQFFVVMNRIKLDPKIYGDIIPETNNGLYIINFTKGNIINPNNDLIGVFGYYGSRRYIWKDTFWGEMHVSSRNIKKMIKRNYNLLKILGDNLFQKKLAQHKLTRGVNLPTVVVSSIKGSHNRNPHWSSPPTHFSYNAISVIYPLKHKLALLK
jgi:hypothetical protein|tara:strand:- start:2294 stop:2788 length:495 start_codon:yes stop_codon:yes gene_type:complete